MTLFYNPAIPTPQQTFSDWQPPMLANFQQLFNAFMANHVSLDAGSSAGNHTYALLQEQSMALQTGAGEIALYTRLNPSPQETGIPGQTDQLVLRYQGNGLEVPLTCYQIYTPATNQYFSMLPGRVLIYFGQFTATSTTYNFNLLPPVVLNIITMNFVRQGSTVGQPPTVTIPTPVGGVYKSIALTINSPPATFFYVVLANI